MNIKTTAYDEKGTLFNFDLIVNNKDDIEKVIRVLRVIYEVKTEEINSHENTGEKPVTGDYLTRIK